MMRLRHILLLLVVVLIAVTDVTAQSRRQRVRGATSVRWERSITGDSTLHVTVMTVPIYKRNRDIRKYQRMVNAVKKVYPLALEAAKRMENLDERLAEFERRKDQRGYTKAIEDALKEEIGRAHV